MSMSELAGIIKNGMQRGWPMQEIYQSLVNTGYSPQEIQMEISKFAPRNPQATPPSIVGGQKLLPYQTPPVQEKKSASKIIIVLIIILVLVILSIGGYLFLK